MSASARVERDHSPMSAEPSQEQGRLPAAAGAGIQHDVARLGIQHKNWQGRRLIHREVPAVRKCRVPQRLGAVFEVKGARDEAARRHRSRDAGKALFDLLRPTLQTVDHD